MTNNQREISRHEAAELIGLETLDRAATLAARVPTALVISSREDGTYVLVDARAKAFFAGRQVPHA